MVGEGVVSAIWLYRLAHGAQLGGLVGPMGFKGWPMGLNGKGGVSLRG